jgi:hypothetical protein
VAFKKKITFSKENEWEEISRLFCRFHGLPFGSELKVRYVSNPRFDKGRIQRSNTRYRRAVFNRNVMTRANDEENIRSLIDNRLLPYIDIDPKALGAEIAAYGPDGDRLDSNTLVRTWRGMDPKPTEGEIEAKNAQLQEIEETAGEAKRIIAGLAEFRWAPEETIPRAVVRALVSTFDPDTVRLAVQAELGKR